MTPPRGPTVLATLARPASPSVLLWSCARDPGAVPPRNGNQRKGTSLSGGNVAAWPWAGRQWPGCGLSARPAASQDFSPRESFVRRHPSDCSFLFPPGPSGVLLWWQGAGGSTGCFHFPPFLSPRNSLPSLATCLGGGDTGPCSCLPPLLHLTPTPGVCARTLTLPGLGGQL